ncbi:MAG: hypothetical protein IPL92_05165 [Saprospiraceae bacterium]|nr:hypothetical protein [Candidatus Opimibacter iunctus]
MTEFSFLFDLPAYQAHRIPQRVAAAMWRQGIKEETSSTHLATLVRTIAIAINPAWSKKRETASSSLPTGTVSNGWPPTWPSCPPGQSLLHCITR